MCTLQGLWWSVKSLRARDRMILRSLLGCYLAAECIAFSPLPQSSLGARGLIKDRGEALCGRGLRSNGNKMSHSPIMQEGGSSPPQKAAVAGRGDVELSPKDIENGAKRFW